MNGKKAAILDKGGRHWAVRTMGITARELNRIFEGRVGNDEDIKRQVLVENRPQSYT